MQIYPLAATTSRPLASYVPFDVAPPLALDPAGPILLNDIINNY